MNGCQGWGSCVGLGAGVLGLTLAGLAPMGVQAQTGVASATPAAVTASGKTLANGVEITLSRPGREPLSYPGPADSVRVHYEGRFEDGRVFDSSYERKQPATFPLSRVIPCWTQGLQHIPVGAAATLRCPAATAYGERGAGGGRIPPNTPLVFQVELLEVTGR